MVGGREWGRGRSLCGAQLDGESKGVDWAGSSVAIVVMERDVMAMKVKIFQISDKLSNNHNILEFSPVTRLLPPPRRLTQPSLPLLLCRPVADSGDDRWSG